MRPQVDRVAAYKKGTAKTMSDVNDRIAFLQGEEQAAVKIQARQRGIQARTPPLAGIPAPRHPQHPDTAHPGYLCRHGSVPRTVS